MLKVEKRILKTIKPPHLKVAFAFLLCGHGKNSALALWSYIRAIEFYSLRLFRMRDSSGILLWSVAQ